MLVYPPRVRGTGLRQELGRNWINVSPTGTWDRVMYKGFTGASSSIPHGYVGQGDKNDLVKVLRQYLPRVRGTGRSAFGMVKGV